MADKGIIRCAVAQVYVGAGRRYLTLRAACRAEARRTVRLWLSAQGEERAEEDWYRPRVERLAGLYRARFLRLSREGQAHG